MIINVLKKRLNHMKMIKLIITLMMIKLSNRLNNIQIYMVIIGKN